MSLPNSGEKRVFTTGAVRDAAEKPRLDLIPWSAILQLGTRMGDGAKHYGDDNWRKGIPYRSYFASAMRHLIAWYTGDKSENHLAGVLFNIGCLMETIERVERGELPSELDDRYFASLHDAMPL